MVYRLEASFHAVRLCAYSVRRVGRGENAPELRACPALAGETDINPSDWTEKKTKERLVSSCKHVALIAWAPGPTGRECGCSTAPRGGSARLY